jgi:uncharacterized membrane protein YidH (DUF202 family)
MAIFQSVRGKAGLVAGAVSLLLPAVALAQIPPVIDTVDKIFLAAEGLINRAAPFLIGLAVFLVMWGVFKFITSAGDETKRAEAQKLVLWGVIGVFVMISIWGFVNILRNTLFLDITPPDRVCIFFNC